MNFFESRLSAALGVTEGKLFLAAVSGGADSTAMLAGLAALRDEAPGESAFSLSCLHVEHGIRPQEESKGDARAVESLCKQLDVPCRVVTVPPGRIAAAAVSGGSGIEGAARRFRLGALHAEARRIGADRILTAHTRDDALETILMRVLRGSGPAGLALMPRQRKRLYRPLLDFTRQDVLQYLQEKNLPWRTDSTNRDISFLRNRIRLKLIPLLDEFFPFWRSSLLSMAETQALTAEFLAAEAAARLPWEAASRERGKVNMIKLREEEFLAAPQILKEEVIFAGVDLLARTQKTPRRSTVRRAVSEKGKLPCELGPARLEKREGFVALRRAQRFRGERGFSLLIKEAGIYTLKRKDQEKKINLHVRACSANAASYAAFHARLPLVLRNHREGDRLCQGGHRRRFSDILKADACSGNMIITACDAEGTAAFIAVGRGGDIKVISRDTASHDSGPGYMGVYIDA